MKYFYLLFDFLLYESLLLMLFGGLLYLLGDAVAGKLFVIAFISVGAAILMGAAGL